MKKFLLLTLTAGSVFIAAAQVTQINSNASLSNPFPLNNTKSVYVSSKDETLWVTDGTLGGTLQLSTSIIHVDHIGSTGFLNGKYIFSATTPATGTELFITDGTTGGTVLVKDINPGAASSSPGFESAVLNGFLYFTAVTPGEGRELWRTDGTLDGTTLVKDIVAGTESSNEQFGYHLFSTGSYLLFAASTPALGVELWKSDGTTDGTVMVEDLNTGNSGADSSMPHSFHQLNNVVLFTAKNAGAGEEFWRSDGTALGTFQLAEINAGAASSTSADLGLGFPFPIFNAFHNFNSKAYFIANNGTSFANLYTTDGTTANTAFIKEIIPGTELSQIFLSNALTLSNKFIFPLTDLQGRSELWESDGSNAGTKVFKAFTPSEVEAVPIIFRPYDLNNGGVSTSLFQGNKFFFVADDGASGTELWISDGVDGTAAHTFMVENINPGATSAFETGFDSYVYTTTGIYFPANNTTNGVELWKSDGTAAGTDIVADILTGSGSSDPEVNIFLVNNKILFEADNGDVAQTRDLYAVDGNFTPLPITLGDFTVQLKSNDAHLHWYTLQELNSKDFTVQRSFDGLHYQELGKIAAAGNSTTRQAYSFIDAGINYSGQNIAYYRLVTTDIDGTSGISPVIALRLKNTGQWTMRLLSNPVPSNLNILLAGVRDNISLTVVDLSGKKLLTRSMAAVNGQISLPMANLPRGSYVLIAETNKERRSVQFIK